MVATCVLHEQFVDVFVNGVSAVQLEEISVREVVNAHMWLQLECFMNRL